MPAAPTPWSRAAMWFCLLCFVGLAFWYYPKWKKPAAEATISWDVSGYYWYLPAFLIYEDPWEQQFAHDVLKTYQPTNLDFQQAFPHESGRYVMKYPIGQAIQFLPAFGAGHVIASLSDYPADGFSRPYQVAITLGYLLMALLGLWALRAWLLRFVSDEVAAITLVLIALGSNYTEYAAITGAMTHNNLFAINALVLLLSARYGENPRKRTAVAIGLLVGLATITRPTEILLTLIPLGWAFITWLGTQSSQRLSLFKRHLPALFLGGVAAVLMGSLQLIYWYAASGHLIVYSYQDQGFDWLSPHISQCLVGYRAGWWTYSPLLIFPWLGYGLFVKKAPKLALAGLLYLLLFMYVAFAWSIWWYGGSLGQRTMISTYPLLAVPLALLIQWLQQQRVIWRILGAGLLGLAMLWSLYWVHQAHRGGLLLAGNMKRAYFWHTLGRFEQTPTGLRLMESNDVFEGEPTDIQILFREDFEGDSLPLRCAAKILESSQSLCLGKAYPEYQSPIIPFSPDPGSWVRVSFAYDLPDKVWSSGAMRQVSLHLFQGDKMVRANRLRLDRFIDGPKSGRQYFDIRVPDRPVDGAQFRLLSPSSAAHFDDITLEAFEEE